MIRDPKVFSHRLHEAAKSALPNCRFEAEHVKYVDPVLAAPHGLRVCFMKHFRYTYQSEYRAVWFPLQPTDALDSVFLNLGPLTDCCELIELEA